jgi:hypothetical protein
MWWDPEDFDRIRRNFEHYQRMGRNLEKMRPTQEQMESLRQQTQMMQEMLSDPKVQRSLSDVGRIVEARNSALAQMPDAATRERLLEAVRYVNSEEFRARRDATMEAARAARQHLGVEGLAAAQRIAARRTATDGSQDQAVERIRTGQAAELLEEATRLATSPEVRETIENTDPEALKRLDEEQSGVEANAMTETTAEPRTAGPGIPDEYQGYTREDWLRMHDDALIALWTLEAYFAALLLTPAAPSVAPAAVLVGGLIAIVSMSEKIISRSGD